MISIVRLPTFCLPAAVDVLTTGTYSRLPTCIRVSVDSAVCSQIRVDQMKYKREMIYTSYYTCTY